MRIFIAGAAILLTLASGSSSQQIFEETGVVNVEIPVRVYQGTRFVDDLTMADFELFEDGKPVPVEAVYFVRKRSIERRDEAKRFTPRTYRSFYLLFEITEYTFRIGEAVDHFMRDVIMPGDSLVVATPMTTYRLKPRAFEIRSREEIAGHFKSLLRRDAVSGSREYRSIIADLENLAQMIISSLSQGQQPLVDTFIDSGEIVEVQTRSFDELLGRYAAALSRLETLRFVDQKQILEFASSLDSESGQKHVYLFYEREFVPKIEPKLLDAYMDLYQDRPDLNQTISGIFETYRREISFDVDKVNQSFADASTAIHFLFITPPPKRTPTVIYSEQSEDVYAAFSEMSRATGGFTASSANPAALMSEAVEAAETYYLVYYSPRPYVRDGRFRNLTVRVKGRDVRVVHRAGYIAD